MEYLNGTREPSPCPASPCPADFNVMGYEIRPLSGPNDPISEKEYVIAFRVDDVLYTSNDQPDNPAYNYFFVVQTSPNHWKGKPHDGWFRSYEITSSVWISDYSFTESNGSWHGFHLKYRGQIYYYAVSY